MLEEQYRVTGFWDSHTVWEGGQGNLMLGEDRDIDNLSEGVDGKEDRYLNGFI